MMDVTAAEVGVSQVVGMLLELAYADVSLGDEGCRHVADGMVDHYGNVLFKGALPRLLRVESVREAVLAHSGSVTVLPPYYLLSMHVIFRIGTLAQLALSLYAVRSRVVMAPDVLLLSPEAVEGVRAAVSACAGECPGLVGTALQIIDSLTDTAADGSPRRKRHHKDALPQSSTTNTFCVLVGLMGDIVEGLMSTAIELAAYALRPPPGARDAPSRSAAAIDGAVAAMAEIDHRRRVLDDPIDAVANTACSAELAAWLSTTCSTHFPGVQAPHSGFVATLPPVHVPVGRVPAGDRLVAALLEDPVLMSTLRILADVGNVRTVPADILSQRFERYYRMKQGWWDAFRRAEAPHEAVQPCAPASQSNVYVAQFTQTGEEVDGGDAGLGDMPNDHEISVEPPAPMPAEPVVLLAAAPAALTVPAVEAVVEPSVVEHAEPGPVECVPLAEDANERAPAVVATQQTAVESSTPGRVDPFSLDYLDVTPGSLAAMQLRPSAVPTKRAPTAAGLKRPHGDGEGGGAAEEDDMPLSQVLGTLQRKYRYRLSDDGTRFLSL